MIYTYKSTTFYYLELPTDYLLLIIIGYDYNFTAKLKTIINLNLYETF